MQKTAASEKSSNGIPIGLVVLVLIPVLAGLHRVSQLALRVPITEENARFFAAPIPVVVHILASIIFCLLGSLQFAKNFRRLNPRWHRLSGRVLVVCGMLAGVT